MGQFGGRGQESKELICQAWEKGFQGIDRCLQQVGV
jgi:hypothetical protein